MQPIGSGNFIRYNQHEAGEILVEFGQLIRTKENRFNANNIDFHFKELKTGDVKILPSCPALKNRFNDGDVEEGMTYKIQYEGKKETKQGDREYNHVTIFGPADENAFKEAGVENPMKSSMLKTVASPDSVSLDDLE